MLKPPPYFGPPRMNRHQAARQIGVDPRTLKNWEAKGIGPPCYKTAGPHIYSTPELLAWIDRNTYPKPSK